MSKFCLALVLTTVVLPLAACQHSTLHRKSPVSSAQTRVFNPQSNRYEWHTPDEAPVSAGADRTSRQPYR